MYHGVLICGYHVAVRWRRVPATEPAPQTATRFEPWAVRLTFALVSLGWIVFRSANFSQSFTLLARALPPWTYRYRTRSGTFYLSTGMLLLAVWAVPMLVARWNSLCAPEAEPRPLWMQLGGGLAQGVAMGCMLVLSLIYLGSQTAFVYFQF